VANKMADKKKSASQSSARSQNQSAARSQNRNQMADLKTSGDEKEANKNVKAASREQDERKVQAKKQESKTVRRDNKGPSTAKGPSMWQIRLRSNRYVRFILDAYYELRHKVTWPTFHEARNMTFVVLLLSAAIGIFLGAIDYGLQNLYILLVHLGGK
jgi:preprotein translocase SecE subunit